MRMVTDRDRIVSGTSPVHRQMRVIDGAARTDLRYQVFNLSRHLLDACLRSQRIPRRYFPIAA
jgi:hypothetical protein